MNIESILIPMVIVVGVSAILGMILFENQTLGTLSGTLGVILLTWVLLGTHINGCTCDNCYKKIGTENGIEIVKYTDNNLYYYNETNKEYIQIIQNDGTTYTYDEFIEKQLEEFD